MDRRRDRHGARIRAAAAERGDALVRADALEARDHRHLPGFEPLDQPAAVDVDDARRTVCGVRLDRDLPALPRARIDAHLLERDGEQPRGHLLAGGDHRVVFARVMERRRRPRPGDELVGRPGHRRDHHRHLVAAIDLALDVSGDVPDAIDVGDGGPAELHYQPCHRLAVAIPPRPKRRVFIATSAGVPQPANRRSE